MPRLHATRGTRQRSRREAIRNEKVRGSNPLSSTEYNARISIRAFVVPDLSHVRVTARSCGCRLVRATGTLAGQVPARREAAMAARFEVFEDAAGEYRWRLVAANGETVAQSEGYTREQGAVEGAEAARRAAAAAPAVG